MGKQVYILNSATNNSGVAKVMSDGKRRILSINLENTSPAKKICQIKTGNEIIEIGSFYKKRTEFEIPYGLNLDGVVILENGNRVFWSDESSPPDETISLSESPHEDATFDNFFGGGFDWHRIRGNFIMFDYSIVHHILSLNKVYRAINRCGYYCAGICEKDNIKIIAIAIPLIKDVSNPFSGISADVYKIKNGKIYFDALCVGIDNTGEFFISN